jgi:lysophospholipase L1-like esterase
MGRGLCRDLYKIRHSFFHALLLMRNQSLYRIADSRHVRCFAVALSITVASAQPGLAEPKTYALGLDQSTVRIPADEPARRSDENSQIAHTELLRKAKQGHIDVYFVGDSITRRWGTSDREYADMLANWNDNFFGWNAANFGWGGDTTQNILWRLRNGELDGVHPKVIVILAGTNNVGTAPRDDAKVADIANGIKAIVDVCREKAPDAVIVLTAIFPRNDNMAVMPTIDRINERIAKFADGNRTRFLNVNRGLADENGKLLDGMMADKLHPTVQGYQVWADGLKPILRELLGPPAAIDRAPPPTGNPAAN